MSLKRDMPDEPFETPSRPRKRNRPFSRPKDARIANLFKRNARESRLLRLPKELREKIAKYLYEPRILHIKRRAEHSAKLGSHGEASPYERISQTSKSLETLETAYSIYSSAEEIAYFNFEHDRVPKSPHCNSLLELEKVDLRLFRTCRQFYFDFADPFWNQTMFSFQSHQTFVQFLLHRTASQLCSIRKLRLALRGQNFDRRVPTAKMQLLTGLHSLYILTAGRHNLEKKGILQFRFLPLKCVKVRCRGYSQEVSHAIRDKLLSTHDKLSEQIEDRRQKREKNEASNRQKIERLKLREEENRAYLRKVAATGTRHTRSHCGWGTKAECDKHRLGLLKERGLPGERDGTTCGARHWCEVCHE
ncbi:hypothetical protein BU16DRAFT_621145 [Lophium mytilinum]|uniref:DUF7730 domain-containing protein n=1 Tax=Lophium mytilinum TaxID=390894 RepID=A0A6A6QHD4_9PEZI|nr:hypothetical protein BU16DRAFT_621145 [Lophium mytilinum]